MDQYTNYIGLTLDDRYKIKRLVGIGGMAMVFEAEDTLRKIPVAIKVLKEEFATDEVSVQRFINESKAVSMLSHSNIVKIYDISVKGEHKYIAMEYIDGITLKNYIEHKGALSVKETISYSIQILRALEHAHLGGIIHRDIKPQNIMLLKNGQIKVTDFGIAKLPDAKTLTATDKAIGTVYYISPEQAAGERGIDRRTDLYSVGVMMYEMITGKLPFDGENPVSIALKQINEEPKPPSTLVPTMPKGLEQIILFAMEKDKDKRFQTATQMIDLLQKVRENNGVVFRQKNRTSQKPHSRKKKVTMLPIIMGVITAFLIVAIVSAFTVIKDVFFSEEANEDETIVYADYVGLEYTDELASELKKQFKVKAVYEFSSTVEAGKILRQEPRAYETKKKRYKEQMLDLTLYVSQGIEELVMGDYVYRDARQAEIDLKNKKFTVEITEEHSEIVPGGCVISTLPAAGEPIAAGSNVVLVVSRGELVETTTVPNFVYSNTVEAYELLVENDLRLGSILYEYSDEYAYGVVMQQSIEAGSSVPKDVTKINFIISKGKAPVITVPAPKLIGLSEPEAALKLRAVGLDIGLVNFANSDKVEYGLVCEQNIAEGTLVEQGSLINIVVSLGSGKKPDATDEPDVTEEPDATDEPDVTEATEEKKPTSSRFDDWLNDRFKVN